MGPGYCGAPCRSGLCGVRVVLPDGEDVHFRIGQEGEPTLLWNCRLRPQHRRPHEQLHSTRRWENDIAEGWRIEDLDRGEIVRTLEEAIRRGRADDPGTRDAAEILRGFGLSKDGHILRAAVALFA